MEDRKVNVLTPRCELDAYIWYVVAECFPAYTVNFIDRQIQVIPLSPIQAELDLKDVHLGLLSGTAFGIFLRDHGHSDRTPRRSTFAPYRDGN